MPKHFVVPVAVGVHDFIVDPNPFTLSTILGESGFTKILLRVHSLGIRCDGTANAKLLRLVITSINPRNAVDDNGAAQNDIVGTMRNDDERSFSLPNPSPWIEISANTFNLAIINQSATDTPIPINQMEGFITFEIRAFK